MLCNPYFFNAFLAIWLHLGMQKEKVKLNIFDLGYGAGLYSEIFAKKVHLVTGVNILPKGDIWNGDNVIFQLLKIDESKDEIH